MPTESFSLFDLAPGKIVAGRFKILRPHRQHELASTFEAEDPTLERRVELTLFPATLFEGETQLREFREAWEPWKRVESPHVARVVDLIALDGGGMLLVTEFSEGHTLRTFVKEKRRLDPGLVRSLGIQMLEGAQAIHRHHLVHGDIKPSTVQVQGSGRELRAVLLDGGVTPALWNAKHLGERTALIGTPFYAPVEQFGGESPDVQSDIYNIATVLFELATGAIPWPGNNFLEVFQAKLAKRAPAMRERAPDVPIDADFEQAVVKGLLADRRERYANCDDFREALRAVAGS